MTGEIVDINVHNMRIVVAGEGAIAGKHMAALGRIDDAVRIKVSQRDRRRQWRRPQQRREKARDVRPLDEPVR